MARSTLDEESTNKNMHKLDIQTTLDEFDHFWNGR